MAEQGQGQQVSLAGLRQIIIKVNALNNKPIMLMPPELKHYPALFAKFTSGKDIVTPEPGVEFKKVMDRTSFMLTGSAASTKIRMRHLVYIKK